MRTFALPDLGEGLQEAEIVAWHVAEGDRIVADQPLVAVETAKAVVEIPAPFAGRVVRLHAGAGKVVAVGAALLDIESADPLHDAGTVVGALPQAPATTSTTPAQRPALRGRISPAVRKIARDLGVDIDAMSGSGPGGSITRADVEAAASKTATASGFAPLRGVRRAMSDSLQSASAGIVSATVADEARIDSWQTATDPTIRLIRAVAAGCTASPALNAWFDAKARARKLHDHIDLALAVNTDDGLFAPVLRDVANRDDTDLRSALETIKRDVAARTVPLSELRGPTITLSNFGMLGGLTAVLTIVAPQVAILGAGRIHDAVRVVDGQSSIVRILPLSLTVDHRAVNGAEAIRFLNAAIESLTRP